MGRPNRVATAGYTYHRLNRAVGKARIFREDGDFESFERVLEEAIEQSDNAVEMMAYSVKPDTISTPPSKGRE